jgi:hypothetical protein
MVDNQNVIELFENLILHDEINTLQLGIKGSIDLYLLKFDTEYQFAKSLAVSVTVLLWG